MSIQSIVFGILLSFITSVFALVFSYYALYRVTFSKDHQVKYAKDTVKRLKRKLNHIQCKIDYLENEVIYQEGKNNEK